MSTLEQAIEVARELAPHELEQLHRTVGEMLVSSETADTSSPVMTEQEYARHLAARGVATLPEPMTEDDWTEENEWQPVEVKGKPLSQIIIEERR